MARFILLQKTWHDFRGTLDQYTTAHKVKRIEKHIFLLLAALAVGLSVICFLLLEHNAPGANDEQYVSAVQQRVKTEMQVSTAELDSVASLLRRNPNPTFTKLFELTAKYPYFVFRNQQLAYWSDYRFIPNLAKLTSVMMVSKLIKFEQSRYIVSHRRVIIGADVLDVFSLVNIYRYYHSSNAYLQSGYNPDLFALDPQDITDKRQNTYQAIYDNGSSFLFSVVPPKVDAYRNHSTPVNTVILATLGIVFLGLYIFQLMIQLRNRRQYEFGFLAGSVSITTTGGNAVLWGTVFIH